MPDEPSSPASDYRHHDGTPGSPADRSAKVAVPDSFPASDPVATTPAVGVRAMDVAEMMEGPDMPHVPHATTVTARFADNVTAKLAVEKLVRDIPLDRRCATLSVDEGRTMLEVIAPDPDMERIREILRSADGEINAQA